MDAWERSILFGLDLLNDAITEGWAAARHHIWTTVVWAILTIEILVVVAHHYGWYGLTHTTYRHRTGHGGVGRRGHREQPYILSGTRKGVYDRGANHYSVDVVLTMARSPRGERYDTGEIEAPIGTSIIQARDPKEDRVVARLRTWGEYAKDLESTGGGFIGDSDARPHRERATAA